MKLHEDNVLYCKHCGEKLKQTSKCDNCGGNTYNFKMLFRPIVYIIVFGLAVFGIAFAANQIDIYNAGKETYCYVGSVNSNKYHVMECDYAKRISSSNMIYFFSDEEARKEGYEPCASCKPTGKIKYGK